jgi:hypothetical protein
MTQLIVVLSDTSGKPGLLIRINLPSAHMESMEKSTAQEPFTSPTPRPTDFLINPNALSVQNLQGKCVLA